MRGIAADKEAFRASFDSAIEIPRGLPSWLQAFREGARERFLERPLPTTKDEAWRFTSVAPIVNSSFCPPSPGALQGPGECALSGLRLKDHRGPEVVFVNGQLQEGLSSFPNRGQVEILSLAQAIPRDPRLEGHLGKASGGGETVFADLNSAAARDGAVVFVRAGHHAEEAIHLLFLSTNRGEAPTASHPRTLVVGERGSRATVVESYGGPPGEAYLTNAVTEMILEEDASIERVKIQREGLLGYHVGAFFATLGRNARLRSHSVSVGGALSRDDLRALLCGPGAECALFGLFVGQGSQHVDHHTFVDHKEPHGTSRELYKGILDGGSRGVFDGRILVRKGAAGTDAVQTNKNLLLSREALVDSTPALEILTDDVKCRHGSTTGQLDEVALFYLRSRGIGESEARSLMTYAFAADVVQQLPLPSLRAGLEGYLQKQLGGLS